MADLEPAWTFLMHLEGGDLMHEVQGDPGGRTRYGIAENFHPEVWADGPPSEDRARDFYRQRYWGLLRLGEIVSQEIANEIFEFSVNASTPRRGESNVAVRTAQKAVNDVHSRTGKGPILVDGLIAAPPRRSQTLDALNNLGNGTVETMAWDGRFNLHQLHYYYGRRRKLVDQFFHGWSVRVWA